MLVPPPAGRLTAFRSKTSETWHTRPDGSRVFDSPHETGARLDSRQGKVAGFLGTCGLVSCVNVLRMAGIRETEQNVVAYARNTRSGRHGTPLCSVGSFFAENNGATNAEDRNEILARYGVHSVALPAVTKDIADYVEKGHGVILSVHANMLYHGYTAGNDLHAVTVTSTHRSADGTLLGFYLCDSNGESDAYYTASELNAALSGRKMNVTTGIIR